MQIKTISIQKYHEYLDTVHEKEFLQSDYQGVKFSQRGWEVEYIEAIPNIFDRSLERSRANAAYAGASQSNVGTNL